MTQEGTSNWDSVKSSEKKKTRTIGSKSKRLHMHSEDALELKFTWEEAQEYLRSPISKPTVFTIENCELEEYNVEEVIKMMEMELGDGWIFHKDCKVPISTIFLI
ncbi:hypothetical protein Hanom_Chr04g00343521 [Helianthus anomalus]